MKLLIRVTTVVILLLAWILPADRAEAGDCGYAYCWGAVAVGPAGAIGYSYSFGSADAAYDAAQEGCEWDCTIVQTFYNSCAAIATADNDS